MNDPISLNPILAFLLMMENANFSPCSIKAGKILSVSRDGIVTTEGTYNDNIYRTGTYSSLLISILNSKGKETSPERYELIVADKLPIRLANGNRNPVNLELRFDGCYLVYQKGPALKCKVLSIH